MKDKTIVYLTAMTWTGGITLAASILIFIFSRGYEALYFCLISAGISMTLLGVALAMEKRKVDKI